MNHELTRSSTKQDPKRRQGRRTPKDCRLAIGDWKTTSNEEHEAAASGPSWL